MMRWYDSIVSHPQPYARIRSLTCHTLAEAIDELAAVESPNEFQARIYATLLVEAVTRWKSGLLSLPEGITE